MQASFDLGYMDLLEKKLKTSYNFYSIVTLKVENVNIWSKKAWNWRMKEESAERLPISHKTFTVGFCSVPNYVMAGCGTFR